MSNNRASLLAGLRTGGVVRSPSVNGTDSFHHAPRTAAVDGHFSPSHMGEMFGKYDQSDFSGQISDYNLPPPTAPATQNAFLQQQQYQLNQQNQARAILQARVQAQAQAVQNAILSGRSNRVVSVEQQQQAMQAQLEMLKLQAYHDQQQLMMLQAQALLSPNPATNNQARRLSSQPPATAAPTVSSFGQSRSSIFNDTAASADTATPFPKRERSVSSALNPNAASFELRSSPPKKAAVPSASATATSWRSSTIDKSSRPTGPNEPLSGRTPLGVAPAASPAKYQGAASWRRPTVTRQDSESKVSNSSSPTSTPPRVYVSTPEETSPSPSPTETSHQVSDQAARNRPPSLRFSIPPPLVSKHTREASFNSSDGAQVLYAPGSDEVDQAPLTAREEASRRLYEGLGIGRPAPAQQNIHPNGNLTAVVGGRFESSGDAAARNYSLPSRQPRGPPASVEELGNRNFASRIRHKALGALLNARDRRSSAVVEAF